MKTHRIGAILLTVSLVGAPILVNANGLRLASQDGFATARGEAFVATADNPSAIYYNPAGITQIEGNSLRAGIYGVYLDPTFQPPESAGNAGTTYRIERHYAAAPQSFFVHSPEDSAWSYGLGLYAPYGGSVSWPQDTGFRAVTLESELLYITANPVVAVKLPYGLSVGAGLMVNYSKIRLEQGLRPYQLDPPFSDYFHFTGDGWSVGYNLGVLWQPHEKLSIGAMLRSADTVDFKGQTDVLYFRPIPTNYTSAAHMELSFPLTAVVGVSYRPSSQWNLEFNADYTDWSSFDRTTIYQATPNRNVQANPPVTLYWEPSWIYKIGVTRYFGEDWRVSAGYAFNENSVPDDYYTPAVPDLNRHFVTLGVGRSGERLDFDIAYQFGFGPDHEVSGSTPSTVGQIAGQNADGTYDFISHAVLVTVGWHF